MRVATVLATMMGQTLEFDELKNPVENAAPENQSLSSTFATDLSSSDEDDDDFDAVFNKIRWAL